MDFTRPISTLDNILQWITRMAILNLCWIAFTILGLGVFGFFPATVASLSVSRNWIMGENCLKIWGVFTNVFRKEFLLANGLGWLLTLFGGVLYFNYQLIASPSNEYPMIITFAFYFLLFVYSLLIIWSFPLLAHYHTNLLNYFKNAMIIGLSKIHQTITIGILLFAIIYYTLKLPTLILFMTFSIFSMVWMWLSIRIFLEIDNMNGEKSSSILKS